MKRCLVILRFFPSVVASSAVSAVFFVLRLRRVFLRCFFGFTFTLTIDIIEVNQLDQCHFSIVTRTGTQLNDTGITTGTASYLFSNGAEQFSDRFFILQITEYNTTLMSSVCFAFRNKRLYIYTLKLLLLQQL